MENITPPTDNLYKFLAIGGLAFALVAFIYLLKQQQAQWERWNDAQVKLLAGGYEEGSGVPTDPSLRESFFRRESAMAENAGIRKQAGGMIGYAICMSLTFATAGFILWWRRIQRHEDAILRATAKKVQRETKTFPSTGHQK